MKKAQFRFWNWEDKVRNLRSFQLLIIVLGCLVLSGFDLPAWQGQEPVSLYEAVAAKRLQVTVRGRSSTFMEPMAVMEVTNLTDQTLSVNLAVGSILKNDQDTYCDLVVLASDPKSIYFQGRTVGTPVTYKLYTYCLDVAGSIKRFPSAEATYRPTSNLASEKVIAVLKNIEGAKGQETFAAQIAVWSAATGKDLTQLQQEMGGADLSLYEGPVNKYLSSSQPPLTGSPPVATQSPSAGPTAIVGQSSPIAQTPLPSPTPAVSSTLDTALVILGVIVLAGILGLIIFAVVTRSRRPQRASSKNAVAKQTRSEPTLTQYPSRTSDRTCEVCGKENSIIVRDGRRICINPTCPTNKRGDQVSIAPKREDTEPIPVQSDGSASNKRVDSGKSPAKEQGRPRVQPSHVSTEPPSVKPPSHYEQTEPIGVETVYEQTEPFEVEDSTTQDKLTLKVLKGDCKGKTYPLWGLEGIISRGKADQIVLDDSRVSTPHAVLDISHTHGGKDRIRDLGSKNGSLKNGALLRPNRWDELGDGDLLQFGLTAMQYDQAKRQLTYEDTQRPPVPLMGNNRWLITRREVPFVDFESGDTAISVPHVYLRGTNGRLEVRDLSSGNGVSVQGRKIRGKDLIFNEEVIQIGKDTEIQVITDISNIPEEIGAWKRLSWIGGGGMADVYRAQKKDSGVIRAIKIPNPRKYRQNNEMGEKYRELFMKEMDLAKQIHHTNLVEAREFGELESSGLPYLVLDYIDGPSLDVIIEKAGAIPAADVAEIANQIGKALNMLHGQHQLIHCDIKPGNIMIDHTGKVYLADLGIATPTGEKLPGLGVREYLPKEVLQGEPVGVDTDVYSLGQTMLHMLTAESLSPSKAQVRKPSLGTEPPAVPTTTDPPATVLMNLAKGVGAQGRLVPIIKKCIEEKRENRYRQMSDLLKEFEPLRASADLKALVQRTGWKPTTP